MADGKYVVGRKAYGCSLCGRNIEKGERHWSEKLTPWDHPDNDGYGHWRCHAACIKFWAATADGWDYELPDPGEFRLQMAEADADHLPAAG